MIAEHSNRVDIQNHKNAIEVRAIDIFTEYYYLQSEFVDEQHKEV